MNEIICKGKLQSDNTVKVFGKVPLDMQVEVYVAFIPNNEKKYFFGAGKLQWQEDNPIIEMYKSSSKKEKARKRLMNKLRKGYSFLWNGYKNRNELYEERENTD